MRKRVKKEKVDPNGEDTEEVSGNLLQRYSSRPLQPSGTPLRCTRQKSDCKMGKNKQKSGEEMGTASKLT